MSTAATGQTIRASWPRRGVLVAVLAVSLALNVLFVAGAAWTRLHGPEGGPGGHAMYRQVVAELDLDPQQRAGFERYVADMHAHSVKMHTEIAPLIAGAWDEFAKPQPDQAQIMRRFDDASRKWREFQQESTAETLRFVALLTPVQREKFVAIVKARRSARRQHH